MAVASKINIATIPAAEFVRNFENSDKAAVRWLGQAGFEVFYKDVHLMIDPYLSDYLAKKYKGKQFPHLRMMDCPIAPGNVKELDWLLCTHRHSDHMDPETIPVILENNPKCRLIAPKAEKQHVFQIGINESKVQFVDAGDTIKLNSYTIIKVLASAHEELVVDEQGHHLHLGYILKLGELSVYHSGDCIPYPGLETRLAEEKIDIALLAVNGRDEFRKSMNVPGNFTFDEAIRLCKNVDIPIMICHHFGMFDFNTVDVDWLIDRANAVSKNLPKCIVPETKNVYELSSI